MDLCTKVKEMSNYCDFNTSMNICYIKFIVRKVLIMGIRVKIRVGYQWV